MCSLGELLVTLLVRRCSLSCSRFSLLPDPHTPGTSQAPASHADPTCQAHGHADPTCQARSRAHRLCWQVLGWPGLSCGADTRAVALLLALLRIRL